jgi:histidinol-phosphate aminotransferase
MLEARAAVRNLKEYHPPLGGRVGLRLDFNENTEGCSPRVLARLRQLCPEDLARYPERAPVEAEVARFLGLAPEQVLLTNGVDEAIHLVCETYLEPADEVLVVVPTFSMYEIYAAATGAQVITVRSGKDFAFPTDELLSRATPRTRLIAIASPNNPTGAVVSREELLRIARTVPQAAVLVDEAYFEFHGETVISDVNSTPNLFVARTFSKAYGMAGLRAGVLAGNSAQMPMVRRVSSPYNVNAAALACLPDALSDQPYIDGYVEQVRRGRARLQQELGARGIPYWPSRANFVLAYFGEARVPFVRAMKREGILVRDRNSDPGCEGCVRISVGTDNDNERLFTALDRVLRELAVSA